jgi:hypothetical protein
MRSAQELILDVKSARGAYIAQITGIAGAAAEWKSSPKSWNVTEVTEHLFWAEFNGLSGMWAALEDLRSGRMTRTYESPHRDMSVEEVIERTWQPKEKAPEGAGPHRGGSLAFWRQSLHGLQGVLDAFGAELKPDELRLQAFPHPISGALDFHQRLEFLRFHLQRHHQQVARILRLQREQAIGTADL